MSDESRTCFRRVDGRPLREFRSPEDALSGALLAYERYGGLMVPYRCRRCALWHLSPADRRTPSSIGSCTDRHGAPKASYPTYDAATRRADILRREQGISLRVYDCTCGSWHLTSG